MLRLFVRMLLLSLTVFLVAFVGEGVRANSHSFEIDYRLCPLHLRAEGLQDLKAARGLRGGELRVFWDAVPTGGLGPEALLAETTVTVIVGDGTDAVIRHVPLGTTNVTVDSVPRGRDLEVAVALTRPEHVISNISRVQLASTRMRTWDRVSRTASDQATTRPQTTTSTQAIQRPPTPLRVAFGRAECRLQAVQNFRKISASHSSVTMNWDEPSDKTGLAEFKIERCATGSCSAPQEWNRPGKDATSATLTNLAVNATHYFRITAVAESNSNCQDSVPSASVRADTIQQPLAAVAGLTAAAPTTNTDTRVKLTWSAPSSTANIDTFEIQRCSGSNCIGWGKAVTPAKSATTTTVTGLTASTTYRFRIRAKAASGSDYQHSPWSTPVSLTTAVAKPVAPTGLTATAGSGSVALAWDNPSNASITRYEYQTRWSGVLWGTWTTVPGSDANTTAYTFTGLNGGTELRIRLRAVNATGTSAAAPTASPWYVAATPQTPTSSPAAPTGLTATAGSRSVTLSWNNPSNASIIRYEYQTRWFGVAWGKWTTVPGSDASTTTYTLTGLNGGTEYRIRLRAVNAAGTGTTAPAASPWYVAATPGN